MTGAHAKRIRDLALRAALGIGFALSLLACGLLRPAPLAQNCAGWSTLGEEARLLTAEALVQPWLMDRVRERQQLPPGTPDDQVYGAVAGSITKVCELERQPNLQLAEIVRELYEASRHPTGRPSLLALNAWKVVTARLAGYVT